MSASGKWSIAVLAVGVLAAYGNSLEGGFHYDDFHSLVWNPHVRDLDKIPSFFADPELFSGDAEKAMYRPLLLVTYAINYALGGYAVEGYHLVNVVLHLLCSLLVWGIGRRAGCGEGGALVAGLLFGLHPLAAEPVNYISSRSESLAAFFFLASFGLFHSEKKREYAAALLCFAAGLLSKSVVIVLPAVLLLHDRWGGERRVEWRRHLPFWGVGLVYVAVIAGNRFLGNSLARAPRGPGVQAWTQCKALVYYLKLALVPVGLNVEHQFKEATHPGEAPVLLSAVLLASLVFAAWCLLPKRHLIWPGWAALTLAPATLVPLNVLVNEHRLYLPVAGLALLVGQGWAVVAERLWMRPAVIGLFLIWGALVFQRNQVWADELSLWGDAAARSPAMPRAHAHLGNALRDQGQWSQARNAYATALELDPAHRAARTNLANLYYEAAGMDSTRARVHLGRAVQEYEKVLKLDPHYREALNNLGSAYMMLGRLEEAAAIYRRVVEGNPNFADAYFNLGLLAFRQERYAEGIGLYERALELRPDAEVYYELGNTYVRLDDLEAALAAYRRANQLQGGEVRYLNPLAGVLLVLGEQRLGEGDAARGTAMWREAREHLRKIVQVAPGYGQAAVRLKQLEARLR